MQGYVCHMLQKETIGDSIISLNSLKGDYPNLYERYTKKYYDHSDRPKLLTKRIPKLNCLWNDVIHFRPLHPYHVYKTLKNLDIKIMEELRFYKIPIEKLQENKNALYLYTKEKYKGPASDINEDDIIILKIEEYKELSEIPTDTVEYFRGEKEKGDKFGIFVYIPHVLSLGKVELKDLEIITWNQIE